MPVSDVHDINMQLVDLPSAVSSHTLYSLGMFLLLFSIQWSEYDVIRPIGRFFTPYEACPDVKTNHAQPPEACPNVKTKKSILGNICQDKIRP